MRVRVLGKYVGDEGAPGFGFSPPQRRLGYADPISVGWQMTTPVQPASVVMQESSPAPNVSVVTPELVMWEKVNWKNLIIGAVITGVATTTSAWLVKRYILWLVKRYILKDDVK